MVEQMMDDQTYTTLTASLTPKTKLKVLEYLAHEGPARQVDVASGIGASEAAVSRSKGPLIEDGIVELTDDNELLLCEPYRKFFRALCARLNGEHTLTHEQPPNNR